MPGRMTVTGLVDAVSPGKGATRRTTRRRMLASAVEVLRERGAAGVTIDEVLARSRAPRGSVYHHFPGGRNQILIEALQYAGESMTSAIDNAASDGPMALLHQFTDMWEDVLRDSDFTAGCPVVAAAISTADEDPQLSADAAEIFDRWRTALTRSFEADGFGTAARSYRSTRIPDQREEIRQPLWPAGDPSVSGRAAADHCDRCSHRRFDDVAHVEVVLDGQRGELTQTA
jgi:AcrR family transcriptional regulator